MSSLDFNHVLTNFDNIFNLIYVTETIIKLTKEGCINRELDSSCIDISNDIKIALDIERNDYINMLTIALEKLSEIKEISIVLEKSLINQLDDYKSTPTIAAER